MFNWGDWGDPRIDALIDKAGVELDTPKRIPMMTEALQIAQDEHLFIPLHQQPMAWAMRKHGRHRWCSLRQQAAALVHDDEVRLDGSGAPAGVASL